MNDHCRRGAIAAALLLLVAGVAHGKPKPPKRKAVKAAIDKARSFGGDGAVRVNHIVGAVGADRFAAIGVVDREGSDCGDHDSVEYPCRWITPFLVVVDGAGRVKAALKVPTADDPHARFGWGIAKLADYDGDGREELAVIFAYTHHPATVWEEERYREIVWVDFKRPGKPRVQGRLKLAYDMGDPDAPPAWKTTFRYGKTKSIEATTTTLDDAGDPEKTRKVLEYDAARIEAAERRHERASSAEVVGRRPSSGKCSSPAEEAATAAAAGGGLAAGRADGVTRPGEPPSGPPGR